MYTVQRRTHHDARNNGHKTHHPVVILGSSELSLYILLQNFRRRHSDELALWDAQVLQAAVERFLRVPAECGYLVKVIFRPVSRNGFRQAFALEGDAADGIQIVLLHVVDARRGTRVSRSSANPS